MVITGLTRNQVASRGLVGSNPTVSAITKKDGCCRPFLLWRSRRACTHEICGTHISCCTRTETLFYCSVYLFLSVRCKANPTVLYQNCTPLPSFLLWRRRGLPAFRSLRRNVFFHDIKYSRTSSLPPLFCIVPLAMRYALSQSASAQRTSWVMVIIVLPVCS